MDSSYKDSLLAKGLPTSLTDAELLEAALNETQLLLLPFWDDVELPDFSKVLGLKEDLGIQCHRCGSRKTTFFAWQDRSADEGTSSIHHCRDCDARWRDRG